MAETDQKVPMALLMGRGSRVGPLIEWQEAGFASYNIVAAISHKPLEGKEKLDVPGIQAAKKAGIPTTYFNLPQFRRNSKAALPHLSDSDTRRLFDQTLGNYLINLPVCPEVVLLQGWDLILGYETLKHFPSGRGGVYNFVNFHPALLPDHPGDKTVMTSAGIEIPVLRGEHDHVIKEAISLKVPTLGITAHLLTPGIDEGGNILLKREIPLEPADTLKSYDARLLWMEEGFTIQVAELVARKIRETGSLVRR